MTVDEGDSFKTQPARLTKRRIGIVQQFRQVGVVDLRDGMSAHARARHLAIITAIVQAAFVAALPKAQVALPAQFLNLVETVRVKSGAVGVALPQAEISSFEVSFPKAQAVRPIDAQREPAIDHHQVFAALLPIEGRAHLDGEQIDDEELHPIVAAQADEQIARMEIMVQDAGLMNAGNQLAQFGRQFLPQARRARLGIGRQHGGKEEVQRNAIVNALGDEDAFAGADVRFLLGEGQRKDRRDAALIGSEHAVEFEACLAGRTGCRSQAR